MSLTAKHNLSLVKGGREWDVKSKLKGSACKVLFSLQKKGLGKKILVHYIERKECILSIQCHYAVNCEFMMS